MVYLATLSAAQRTELRMLGCLMNYKLEVVYKEAAVTYFKLLSNHSSEEIEQNRDISQCQDSR
jgi:hypothetical protein